MPPSAGPQGPPSGYGWGPPGQQWGPSGQQWGPSGQQWGQGGPPGPAWPPPAAPPDQTARYPQWGAQSPPAWQPRPRTGWSRPSGSWWDRLLGAPATAGAYAGTPPTYFWQALVCLFLFLPTGVAAVVYSLMVTRRAQLGDGAGSVRASQLARLWCLATVVLFVVAVVVTAATGWQA